MKAKNIHQNVLTDFNDHISEPEIDQTAYIHPMACVIGNVVLGKNVMVSPFASVRGDEGQPISIGMDSNVQDGVIIHGLETQIKGKFVEKNTVYVEDIAYSVFIGERVSLAHQCHIHGPAVISDDCFIMMKSFVFNARIQPGCVIEPMAAVMNCTLPPKKYVPAGTIIKNQEDADDCPDITEDYPFAKTNKAVVHVNTSLAKGYQNI